MKKKEKGQSRWENGTSGRWRGTERPQMRYERKYIRGWIYVKGKKGRGGALRGHGRTTQNTSPHVKGYHSSLRRIGKETTVRAVFSGSQRMGALRTKAEKFENHVFHPEESIATTRQPWRKSACGKGIAEARALGMAPSHSRGNDRLRQKTKRKPKEQ